MPIFRTEPKRFRRNRRQDRDNHQSDVGKKTTFQANVGQIAELDQSDKGTEQEDVEHGPALSVLEKTAKSNRATITTGSRRQGEKKTSDLDERRDNAGSQHDGRQDPESLAMQLENSADQSVLANVASDREREKRKQVGEEKKDQAGRQIGQCMLSRTPTSHLKPRSASATARNSTFDERNRAMEQVAITTGQQLDGGGKNGRLDCRHWRKW